MHVLMFLHQDNGLGFHSVSNEWNEWPEKRWVHFTEWDSKILVSKFPPLQPSGTPWWAMGCLTCSKAVTFMAQIYFCFFVTSKQLQPLHCTSFGPEQCICHISTLYNCTLYVSVMQLVINMLVCWSSINLIGVCVCITPVEVLHQ